MIKRAFYMVLVIVAISSCSGNNPGNSNNNGEKSLTATEVRKMAKEAYIHCFPIFENY
jgi:hypothetical protein